MIEEEPKKKSKKELKQERLSYAKAIRLEEQMNEEQRAQIARDEEIARQWDEEERKRAMDEAKTAKKIDWNDPSVIRYHTQKMKPKIVWDFNQNIEPMDAEHGSEKQKSPEKVVEEEVDTQEELKEGVKEPGAKRKKSIPRKSTRKRQKLEEDAEKDELKGFLDIVPREEAPIGLKHNLQIFRGDGSSKNYKILSEMLEDFDRLDVEELFRLVKERYSTSRPEEIDDMLKKFDRDDLDKLWSLVKERLSSTDPTDDKERTLWVKLKRLFKPDTDDIMWKLQRYMHDPLTWRLYDTCGVHHVSTDRRHDIFMLVEKDYPLTKGLLTLMLCNKLQVDQYSEMADEILRKTVILANRPRQ
ncbi:hypothetical protein Tco_1334972 [Tanacetum coccineum]